MASTVGWLIVWGVIVGLDLITGPQVMIARPLVAGWCAGWIVGDPLAGAAVGMLLELFALEVMPLGAARYPDYGLGAVVAAHAAAGAPGVLGVGTAVGLGLIVAHAGDVGIQLVRRANTADLQRHRERVDGGDARVIVGLHGRGMARDALRCLVLVSLGLLVSAGLQRVPVPSVQAAVAAALVAVGIGLGTGLGAALQLTGPGRRNRALLAAGVAAGLVWVLWP